MSLSIQTLESATEEMPAEVAQVLFAGRAAQDAGNVSPVPPEALAQLQEAFRAFNDASERFAEHYARLESRIAELNLELETANARLRHNLEEKQKMQNYLSTLLESLPVGVIGADWRGRVCSLNRRASEILGCDPTHASRRSLLDVLAPNRAQPADESAHAAFCETIRSGFATDRVCDTEFEHLSETRRRVLRVQALPTGQASAVEAAEGEAAGVVLVEDVTDIRRLEQQATRNSRLTAMGEIAMNVAHEIRNPLGSIELFASMLQRDLAHDPVNGPLAGHITTGVRCMDHIVSNILQFARPQRLSCTAFDLNDLIDETLLYAEHLLRQKEIAIEREYGFEATRSEDRPLAPMRADAELLKQVFLNLFLNAIQATPERGTIGVGTEAQGDAAIVRVWDTGPGFTAEVLGKLFDPFFTTRRKGTGLGLTIVHNIVRSHQGSIDAENRPEGGALFTIALPRNLPRNLIKDSECAS